MKLITRDELREKLDRGDELKLVMALSESAYRTKRIPTSIHFDSVSEALAALDPAEEIVVYCADVHCAASIYAYDLLESAGFTRVRRYAGGVAAWEAAGYPLEGDPVVRSSALSGGKGRIRRPFFTGTGQIEPATSGSKP